MGFQALLWMGYLLSAVNIHEEWKGFAGEKAFAKATGCDVIVRNDADVAGYAEMRYGAGRDAKGGTMLFTLGTGIGSTMFVKGQCVPNLELGHLFLPNHKKDVEQYASDRARQDTGAKLERMGQPAQ